ncbi:MAG: histidine phosphatase family protein [Bacteroidota bacterium]|nr:histidine phosphatase family protein [Bacteroidota bacterium]
MKTLVLVRHAKSSWDNADLSDFERPLNERGKEDALIMAKRLIDKKIKIDAFVSSPAKRARKTAKFFMEEYGENIKNLRLIPFLYEAAMNDFYHVVETLNDKDDAVALFSHNPGITEFVNSLHFSPVQDMPTCGVYALAIEIKYWKDFNNAVKKFLFFDYPKNV